MGIFSVIRRHAGWVVNDVRKGDVTVPYTDKSSADKAMMTLVKQERRRESRLWRNRSRI